MVPVKKSPKKRFLLKELPENLPKEVEQFLNFYRSIPPDDPTYTKKYWTVIALSHINQTMGNERAVRGPLFRGPFFPGFIDTLSGFYPGFWAGKFFWNSILSYCHSGNNISRNYFLVSKAGYILHSLNSFFTNISTFEKYFCLWCILLNFSLKFHWTWCIFLNTSK